MRVSYKWLKELVDLEGISYQQLVDDLSLYIVEVDGVSKLAFGTNLITAEVKECINHPNSDHLHICQVDTGKEILQVVCGAPNVAKGQKVILALPGAELEAGTIKKGVIRGVESNGMICSLQELNVESKFVPQEFQNGIYVLDENAPLGMDALAYLGLDDDLIELGLTPNRMDLMSMYGVANDVAALYGRDKYIENYQIPECGKNASDEISVELETADCLTYNARVIKNVKIHESPEFIKTRLMASGVRPINNVVDITNYILMLFGQPLHAFDKDQLGNKIVVRNAYPNEEVVTLDDIKRKLSDQDIVITDGTNVTCVAGVMGCSNTEVTNDTVNIVLEAAVFNPLSVRKTSSRLGLRSESSVRYERGVDINRTKEAMNYACYLFMKYADGEVLDGIVSKGIQEVPSKTIELSLTDCKKYLGVEVEKVHFEEILTNLGFDLVQKDEDNYQVIVPNRRMDITIKADLVEEIARLYGYENLQTTLPAMAVVGELTTSQKRQRIIRQTLSKLGLNEVVTYALVSDKQNEMFKTLHHSDTDAITLLHPMSEDHQSLRKGLIPSLLEVVQYNSARKLTDVQIYEMGSVYYKKGGETFEEMVLAGAMTGKFNGSDWQQGRENVDFYVVKGIIENLEKQLGLTFKYQKLDNPDQLLHPGRACQIKFQNEVVGYIAGIHPAYQHTLGISDTYVFEINLEKILKKSVTTIKFQPLIKKPSITRDLALVMDKTVPVGDVMETIQKVDKDIISKVTVFDLYQSELLGNKKSIACSITFEGENLTDELINNKINKILDIVKNKYQAELRA